MNTIFMNSGNSKISDPQRLLLNLSDKVTLKRSDQYVALSNLSIYYTWKKKKNSFKNNTFNISDPTWNEVFELLDGLYSVSDIQEYFERILKKRRGKINDNKTLSIKIYVNKIEKRITSKPKTRYYLEV